MQFRCTEPLCGPEEVGPLFARANLPRGGGQGGFNGQKRFAYSKNWPPPRRGALTAKPTVVTWDDLGWGFVVTTWARVVTGWSRVVTGRSGPLFQTPPAPFPFRGPVTGTPDGPTGKVGAGSEVERREVTDGGQWMADSIQHHNPQRLAFNCPLVVD